MTSVRFSKFALTYGLAVLLALLPQLPARAADPYEINVVLPLTGFAAFLGQGEAKTFAIVEEIVNKQGGISGRPIKFVIADDQSSPQIAVQLTNAIIAKNVPVMFGSTITAMCLAQAPLLKGGPVDWCLSPTVRPAPGSYTFVAVPDTDDFVETSLRYANGRGWTKEAVVTTTDSSGHDFDSSFDRGLAKAHLSAVTVVSRQHFNISDLSAAAQVARIKESGAQAIFGWVTGTSLGTLLHALSDSGLDVPVFTSPANLEFGQLREMQSIMPKELLFPATAPFAPQMLATGPEKNEVLECLDALRSHGVQTDQGTLAPWTPAFITVAALRKYGTNATAEQVRSFIASYNGAGVLGPYDFPAHPQRGVDASTVLIARWDKTRNNVVAVSKFGGESLR
jgi:branched-chain amino acid transport system substrate-binding protein